MSIEAWRYWWLQPRATGGEFKLISPYAMFRLGGLAESWSVWETGRYLARCSVSADHVAPQQGCDCGVYGSLSLVDLLFQARMVPKVWKPSPGLRFVMGRVEIVDPVFQKDPFDPHVDELRGSEAVIEQLWVSSGPTRPDMMAALKDRYGVAVEVGEPRFTLADWVARTPSPKYRWGKVGLHREDALDYVPLAVPAGLSAPRARSSAWTVLATPPRTVGR